MIEFIELLQTDGSKATLLEYQEYFGNTGGKNELKLRCFSKNSLLTLWTTVKLEWSNRDDTYEKGPFK